MGSITQAEWAYLAGFMDGEGSFSIVRSKRIGAVSGFRYSCYCEVGNTNEKVVKWIISKFNGKLRQERQRKSYHKVLFVIYFSPNNLRRIIPNLYPFLIIKRRQAEICLSLLKMNDKPCSYSFNVDKEKHQLWSELRKLNFRKRHGDDKVDIPEFQGLREWYIKKPSRICDYPECNDKHYAKGYCRKHYSKKQYFENKIK